MSVEKFGMKFFAIFHITAGFLMLIETALSRFSDLHVGVLGALSITLGFMIVKVRREAVILTSLLFLPMTAFSVVTLYASLKTYLMSGYRETILICMLAAVYLTLTTSSFMYILRKRKEFVR
ncbi:MAG: hypothetical protein QXL67_02615 [Candidatus Bathyarchaeia archaeon]